MAAEITVDGLLLAPCYVGSGTHRYLVNLLHAMAGIVNDGTRVRLRVLLPPGSGIGGTNSAHEIGVETVDCPMMRFGKAWRLGLFHAMRTAKSAGRLFFPTPLPLYRNPKRVAVTIHDTIPLVFPDQFCSAAGRLLRYSLRSSLAKASVILTDSAYSKNDIILRCALPAERVAVAYLGFDSGLFDSSRSDSVKVRCVLDRYGITRPYLLHVGAIEPRKNLLRLVRAYQLLVCRQKSPEFQLVLCGRLAWGYQELLNLLKTSELRGRVVLTGPVPDADLPVLYKSSVVLALPSLYEGFGLPLLEAMACATPVVSSNRTSLPEVGGDAPVYFNPESVEEMADAIERVLNDSTLRQDMVERGLRRAKMFSWEDCARKTLSALLAL